MNTFNTIYDPYRPLPGKKETMILNRYQERVEGFMNPDTLIGENRMNNALLGLAGETGETCDIWKKHKFHGRDLDRTKMIKEVGDVLFYVAETASALGVTLEDVALLNLEKLSLRYPTGKFSVQDSLEKKDESL